MLRILLPMLAVGSEAFATPASSILKATIHSDAKLQALSPLALPEDLTSRLTTPLFSDTHMLIALNEDIPLEDAFSDQISFTDGPVGVLLAAFGLFVVLAVGFKAVMSEMDTAIEKVLQDFEINMKQYHPKRWNKIEEKQLAGLTGDERDMKLLQVMEQLQKDEPEFMTKLANRSVTATTAFKNNEGDGNDS